ncbi:MAG: DedA family protein [Akkermansia sp.]
MMHDLIMLWMEWVDGVDYWGIFLLMAMESSICPVPSEVVIIPSVIAATQGHSDLSFWWIIVVATAGTWAGSALTYWVARFVGRPLIERYGKYIFMPKGELERAEVFLERYEKGAIFFSRLLPVLRHLISIPAGLVRMNFWSFSLLTSIGSFLWCTVLAWYGQRMGVNNPTMLENPTEFIRTAKAESLEITIVSAIIALLYFTMLRLSSKKVQKK